MSPWSHDRIIVTAEDLFAFLFGLCLGTQVLSNGVLSETLSDV